MLMHTLAWHSVCVCVELRLAMRVCCVCAVEGNGLGFGLGDKCNYFHMKISPKISAQHPTETERMGLSSRRSLFALVLLRCTLSHTIFGITDAVIASVSVQLSSCASCLQPLNGLCSASFTC